MSTLFLFYFFQLRILFYFLNSVLIYCIKTSKKKKNQITTHGGSGMGMGGIFWQEDGGGGCKGTGEGSSPQIRPVAIPTPAR